MPTKDILDIFVYVSAVAVAITVGRTNIKKQTITDLSAANLALKERVEQLETALAERDQRICHLEEVIDGYSELVREGYLAGGHGQAGGNSSAHSKNPKNRGP